MSAQISTLSNLAGAPLLGHVPQLLLRPLAFLDSLRSRADIVVIRFGALPVYVLNDTRLVYKVLAEDAASYHKGVEFDKTRPLFGNGLLMSEDSFHRRQRRLVQPMFHRPRIAGYAAMMQQLALESMNAWRDGQTVPMDREFRALALRIVAKALFSADIGAQAVEEVERSLPVLLAGIGRRAVSPSEWLERLPIPSNLRFNAALRRMRSIIDRIIHEYRSRDTQGEDLLTMLLQARDADTGEGMTDQQVHDEAMTLMITGSETSANLLSWTCHLLAGHPECQQRLQAEVDEVLGGRPVTIDDLEKLKYMRQVIRETLRLYPPTFLLTRRATSEVELGGHRLPTGSMVAFSIYAMHRDPAVFPEADRFDPDRWLPERAGAIPRNAYIPFGTGGRKCIGEPFAWLEMQVVLSALAARWTVSRVPGVRTRAVTRTLLVPDHLPLIVQRRA
jgi:cytochrome P450